MLKIEGLSVSYGLRPVLRNISLEVQAGEILALIGPNGAGKSTLFKTISGSVPARSGDIQFFGESLLTMPVARRAHLGIAHVPEGRQVLSP